MTLFDISQATPDQLAAIAAYLGQGAPLPTPEVLPKETYVGLALDRSASMLDCLAQTISGFNSNLDSIRAGAQVGGGKTFVSLVTFGGYVHTEYVNRQPDLVQYLADYNYRPGGSTPLYDGIWRLLDILEPLDIRYGDGANRAFLVPIFTDGEENSSKYSGTALSQRIVDLKNRGNWTFTVSGANINLNELANKLSIPLQNVLPYVATPWGTQQMYATNSDAFGQYFRGRSAGLTSSNTYFDNTNIPQVPAANPTLNPTTTITEAQKKLLEEAQKALKTS